MKGSLNEKKKPRATSSAIVQPHVGIVNDFSIDEFWSSFLILDDVYVVLTQNKVTSDCSLHSMCFSQE